MSGTKDKPDQSVSANQNNEYWWREVYYEDFATGRKKSPEQLANPNAGHWLEEECAAWVYEIVRRHPKTKDTRVNCGGEFKWPAFTQLSPLQRSSLAVMVSEELGMRPIVTFPGPLGRPRLPGYSDSIPGYSFDLMADEAPLMKSVMGWIDRQCQKHHRVKHKGQKGAASTHNKRDVPRDCNWQLVELMDHRKGLSAPLTDTERTQKSKTLARAATYLPKVVKSLEGGWEDFSRFSKIIHEAFIAKLPHVPDGTKPEPPQPEMLEKLMAILMRSSGGSPVNQRIWDEKGKVSIEELREIVSEAAGPCFDEAAFMDFWGEIASSAAQSPVTEEETPKRRKAK